MARIVGEVHPLIEGAERLVILTGAGISTDSGIPDFRGPNGVWTKDPAAERASYIQHWIGDPEARRAGWRMRLDSPVFRVEPNRGHLAIAERAKRHGGDGGHVWLPPNENGRRLIIAARS